MKKISHFTWVGYIIGMIFSIGSFIRYYIIYQDTSAVIIGVLIGFLILAVSFLYNRQLNQGHSIEGIEDYLSDKNFNNKK